MIDTRFLDAIKRFEGFTPRAQWDYAQSSNGFGTRAKYHGEVIDRAEAERRFKDEIKTAYDIVERFAPKLDPGTKAALTSLTFNAGTSWTKAGLGQAIRSGDLATAREIFQEYTKAGGQTLAGLEMRRAAEAEWFQAGGSNDTARAPLRLAADVTKPHLSPPLNMPPQQNAPSALAFAIGKEARASSDPWPFAPVGPQTLEHLTPAALTLANLLSILTLSHTTPQDDKRDEEQRALEPSSRANIARGVA